MALFRPKTSYVLFIVNLSPSPVLCSSLFGHLYDPVKIVPGNVGLPLFLTCSFLFDLQLLCACHLACSLLFALALFSSCSQCVYGRGGGVGRKCLEAVVLRGDRPTSNKNSGTRFGI